MLKINTQKSRYKNVFAALAVFSLLIGTLPVNLGAQSINELQRQIDEIDSEIDQSQERIEELRNREDTLQNRLDVLEEEERQIRSEISSTESEIETTQAEIKEKENELQRTKELIQENVKVLYKEGNPSTLEMLFSSENFTDFINRQEYLDKAKSNLNEAARESVQIKSELEEKQLELEDKSQELQSQRVTLQTRLDEQEKLIEQTRGEEARYQEIVSQQQQERERLEEQQRAAYAAAAAAARDSGQFVATDGNGSYPWANEPYPCWTANCVDPWDLFYRECVSYTAWKVADSGRFVPKFAGAGHAREWPDTTSRHGIDNGHTPKVGSVAIDQDPSLPYGHSMYVEEVFGNGNIRVSEYNLVGPGQYSERIIPASGLIYIYF